MKKRETPNYMIVIVFSFLFLFACKRKLEKKLPNIIFIMSDDHAYQAISAYGHGLNNTPNIDRLAHEGVLFQNSFVTNSICAPSRATMLTGKFSHKNGQIDNIHVFDGGQSTFPKILKNNGYNTALVGKWHLKSEPTGFDYWNILPDQGHYYNPDFIANGTKVRYEGYVTDITTDLAIDWLKNKRDQNKPFCLLIHHKAPHRNWMPDEKYYDLFKDSAFRIPSNFIYDFSNKSKVYQIQDQSIANSLMLDRDCKLLVDENGDSTEYVTSEYWVKRMNESQKKAWLDYYSGITDEFYRQSPTGKDLVSWKFKRYLEDYLACIQSVDDGVGKVLEYLDENKLAKNTIVVYTSDQGFFLGEHGLFDKRLMYEESFRPPLIVRYPSKVTPGTRSEELVQNIDYAPTFIDFAGIEIPEDIQGESLAPLLTGEKQRLREAVYYHYYEFPSTSFINRHYGVRTDRYKLIHFYFTIDEWELYDLKNDPCETENIYSKPENAQLVQDLKDKLYALREKYDDPPENDSIFIQTTMKHPHYKRHKEHAASIPEILEKKFH